MERPEFIMRLSMGDYMLIPYTHIDGYRGSYDLRLSPRFRRRTTTGGRHGDVGVASQGGLTVTRGGVG